MISYSSLRLSLNLEKILVTVFYQVCQRDASTNRSCDENYHLYLGSRVIKLGLSPSYLRPEIRFHQDIYGSSLPLASFQAYPFAWSFEWWNHFFLASAYYAHNCTYHIYQHVFFISSSDRRKENFKNDSKIDQEFKYVNYIIHYLYLITWFQIDF